MKVNYDPKKFIQDEYGNLYPKKVDKRKYPCPKCKTGELYDSNAGGMFGAIIECNNPDCNYSDLSDLSGCVTA